VIGSRAVAAAAVALEIVSVTSPSPAVRPYDDNGEHLWNRLHAALFVRVAADGREYGGDRVDPLLWIGSKYLLQGASHQKAIALLTEFVDTHGEKLIDNPLKRSRVSRSRRNKSPRCRTISPAPLSPTDFRAICSRPAGRGSTSDGLTVRWHAAI